MNTKLNLPEFEGVWTWYFSPQLSKGRNRPPKSGRNQKQNQDSANKVGSNTANNKTKEGKPSRKKQNSFIIKNLKKGLNSSKSGKLTLLAEIRSLLRRLEN
ncbi:uncharacterized protein OCT59_010685 [Rhizophagus irregularis]|nr:hypothetical protein GLOIN_2v1469939 [Rhizophagus irregularis DAOM 181602=DAOM 197198]POG82673.1 hypothetical protein GLOIN_2v1469939 [Rhizophagus irregularis DAOM 181602=DAOM 197198]UZO19388.1 hypothetical protein OCT59_010685 [Rhizophagus irregularis]GBC13174.1 hypothetical protein GLOIN_2v1469939 [Rhizophagus irregularis DAOM 181602=DAOM 197198]|eukprot:XP_025189539.1 hypothetical protein GLOIN_2v1469939 [Rhizophagus irregularis DAOM 181602=DAOM 197198]